jgi:hypothetical protein
MKTERIYGTLTAKTPIHHGGDESTGARSTLRRMKYIVDGKRIDIPVISGNSIRGVLRRTIMAHMLETIRYGQLKSLKTYHMLFAGGTLESVSSDDSGNLNLELRRYMRDSIPALSVFGSAIGNQMIEGKMKCGFAIPQCCELGTGDISIYGTLADDFTTRRDDLHGEREEGEAAHQMIVNIETFAPGTKFNHMFTLLDCNEIESGVLAMALALWDERPYAGGKSSIGYGELVLDYNNVPDVLPYMEYLRNNASSVREAVAKIEEMLG